MQGSEIRTESTAELMESGLHVLNFLDSMDSYLVLMDSLSSTLRQRWMELASARHSMGATRVSSALFNLKSRHASTMVEVDNVDATSVELPHFTLCKWTSSDDPEKNSGETKSKNEDLSPTKAEKSPQAQNEVPQERREVNQVNSPDNHVQKERSKSLSMFGTLVSPKLRATQLSFETALEMLVEISNVRASLLCAHEQVQKDLKAAK